MDEGTGNGLVARWHQIGPRACYAMAGATII